MPGALRSENRELNFAFFSMEVMLLDSLEQETLASNSHRFILRKISFSGRFFEEILQLFIIFAAKM
jgi:hypothetical protein